ncbi:MAG: stage II sporulation protein M [Candidatus Aenigmarchaeota archaeon]|nr:stage II sporulation protein M [Candidatus Aenigmarchaeota archaeon]
MVSAATNFWVIVQNNLWVFAITFLVSFFISAGGIFVLVWNASILGVFLSNLIMGPGCPNVPAILSPTCYIVHGILEIIAYIIAGIAGSLFSKQFSLYFFRKIGNEEVFMRIWKDVTILVSIGVLLIFVAGAVEVF